MSRFLRFTRLKTLPKTFSRTLPRTVLCALFLALPVGFAQGFYFGVGVGTPLSSDADEITEVLWLTAAEVAVHPKTPAWTRQSIEKAEPIGRGAA